STGSGSPDDSWIEARSAARASARDSVYSCGALAFARLSRITFTCGSRGTRSSGWWGGISILPTTVHCGQRHLYGSLLITNRHMSRSAERPCVEINMDGCKCLDSPVRCGFIDRDQGSGPLADAILKTVSTDCAEPP